MPENWRRVDERTPEMTKIAQCVSEDSRLHFVEIWAGENFIKVADRERDFQLSVSLIFVSPVLKIRPENLDADGVLICNNLMCFQIIVEHTVNFHTIKNSTISPISPSLHPCAPPAALGVVQSSRSSSDEDWKSVSRSPNMSPNGSAYRSAPCWDCQKRK